MADTKTTVLEQKIKLNLEQYSPNVKKANQELKSATNDMNNSLVGNSKEFEQNESQIKKWGKTLTDNLKKAGQAFASNLATGAKAMTLGLGGHAIKHSADEAISMAFNASKAFADLNSRVNASTSQLDKWKSAVGKSAVATKTSLDSMVDAFAELSDSVDSPDKILDFMDSIGQATMMNGGNSKDVTEFIKKSLTEQGKDVNKGNVNELLGSADLLRRNGKGFGTMGAAMKALGGLDQHALAESGLNGRDIAGLLAGASKTGIGSEKAMAGVQALLGANSQGQLSALSGILGGGSLMGKNGKLDISKLGSAGALAATEHGGDERTQLEVFKQMVGQAGVGNEGAEALFKMIRNFKDLNATMEKTEKDQTTLADSAKLAGDNLKDMYQQLETTLVTGFTDIFKGFENPIKSLFGGDVGGAAGGMGGALSQMGKGIAEHPVLAAGAVLTTAAGGALISSLMKSIPGMGGAAGAVDLAKGVGIGNALKQAGVTPVYVVNANDIGKDQSMLPSTVKDMMGAGGIAGQAANMGRILPFLKSAGMVGLAAGAGVAIGGAINQVTGNTGQLGGWLADKMGPSDDEIFAQAEAKQQKVIIEIDSKDPGFSARPKAMDNPKDTRTQ